MEDLTGKQFGPYQIVAPLGEGGMAAVYKAYQPAMERYVALKVLPRHFADDAQFVARFQREAKLLAQLQHPHILPVFDYGQADGYTYIVMPFVRSGTLTDSLKGQPLPLPRIRQVISQVGDALNYAHTRGLIHRDVKPSNVLIDEGGNCLLTDFGLARMVETSVNLTTSGTIMGTPAYMSPEQGSGQKIDARSDIYSLGVILYEMATGRVPYRAETPIAVVFKHIQDPLPPARSVNPELSEAVELVILKALSKSPEDRYQTAGDMVRAIQAAIADIPAVSTVRETLTRQAAIAQAPTLEHQGAGTQSAILAEKPKRASLSWAQVTIGAIILLAIAGGLFAALGKGENSTNQTASQTAKAIAAIPTDTLQPNVAASLSANPGTPSPIITAFSLTSTSTPTSKPSQTLHPATIQATSDTTIIYLSDIQPRVISAAGGNYCIGRDPVGDPPTCTGARIAVQGIPYPHSLFAHADSTLVFDIEGRYDTLVTSIFLFGSACGDGATFRVELDGREIFMSSTIEHGDIPRDLRLDIKGGYVLRLETFIGSNGDFMCDGTVWGEPYLIPIGADSSVYDSFNDPAKDGALNQTRWSLVEDVAGTCNVAQEDGHLVIKHTPSPSPSYASCYLTGSFEGIGGSSLGLFEAKLRVSNDFRGNCCVALQLGLVSSGFSGGGSSMLCGLHAGPGDILGVFALSTGGGEEYSRRVPTTFNQWHTLRFEVNQSDFTISCYIDDSLVGSVIPKDADILRDATFGRQLQTGYPANSSATFLIDDVRVVP